MFDADSYQATISDALVTSNCPLIVIDTERSIQAASQINTVAHRLGRHFKSFFVPKRKIRRGPISPLTQHSKALIPLLAPKAREASCRGFLIFASV